MVSVSVGGKAPGRRFAARSLALAVVNASLYFLAAVCVNWQQGLDPAMRSGEKLVAVVFLSSLSMAFMLAFFLFPPGGRPRSKPAARPKTVASASTGGKAAGKRTVVRAFASAAVIASLFFLWGLIVNWEHGREQAIRAGMGQASVSFVMSMSMAFILEFFFFLLHSNKFLRIPFAVAGTMSIVVGMTAMVHVMIGTPEIIKTMTLPFLMGVGYTSLYSFRLSRMDKDGP